MKSYPQPTPQQVSEAITLLAHPQLRRVFFEKIENPHWVKPLNDAGFFADPPAPIYNEEDGTTQYRYWPQIDYLRTVVKQGDEKPQALVSEILQGLEIDNPFLREEILEIGAILPVKLAEPLARKQAEWIRTQRRLSFGVHTAAANLVKSLLSQSSMKTALSLLWAVGGIDETLTEQLDEKQRGRLDPLEDCVRLREYEFAEFWDEVIPPVVAAQGRKALPPLISELVTALNIRFKPLAGTDAIDYSYMWRERIREAPAKLRADIANTFVSAVYHASQTLAGLEAPEKINEILSALESGGWPVLRRIAKQVLAEVEGVPVHIVLQRLPQDELFDESASRPETWELARAHWSRLPQDFRTRILDRIDAGPDVERCKTSFEHAIGREPSNEETEAIITTWRMSYLREIHEVLDEMERKRLQHFINSLPQWEADHPEPPGKGAVGVRSPKTLDELLGMPDVKLQEFLNSWTPSQHVWWEDRGALAGQWRDAVAKEPQRIAAWGTQLLDLPRDVRYQTLRGFAQAVKEGKDVDFGDVQILLTDSISQPPEQAAAHHGALDFVSEALRRGSMIVLQRDREAIWEIIESAAGHPSPTPEYEEQYGPPNTDPYSLSLNTVRPSAVRLAIQFAIWERQSGGAKDNAGLPADVQTLLEKHLDPRYDSSVATRAVYGASYPKLYALDQAWAEARALEIFSLEAGAERLFYAAWDAYLLYSQYYSDVYRALRRVYEHAVEQVGSPRIAVQRVGLEVRLATHLQIAYIQGIETLSDSGLLAKFYRSASPELVKNAVSSIGYGLKQRAEPLDEKAARRYMAIWEYVLRMAKDRSREAQVVEEAGAFGPWFESGRFGAEWSLRNLIQALKLCKTLDDSHGVMARLAELAEQQPMLVVEAFEHIVNHPESVWAMSLWKDSAAKIVRSLKFCGDKVVQTRTERIRNWLGEMGLNNLEGIE